MNNEILFLGVKGSVVAIEKKTGKDIWTTHLKSSSFVSLAIDNDVIFAHTNGNLYCVDKKTGEILWHNGLKGLGYGLGMIAFDGCSSGNAVMAEQIQAQQAAAAAATSAAIASSAAANSSS